MALLLPPAWGEPLEHDIQVLHFEASKAVARKDYATARQKAVAALDMAEKSYGKVDQRLLQCLEKLYDVNIAAGDRKRAEGDRRRMLSLVQAVSGPNSPETAQERIRMADFLALQERWTECNQLYELALPALLRSSGQRATAVARIRDYVQLLHTQGKDDLAAAWEARANNLETNPTR